MEIQIFVDEKQVIKFAWPYYKMETDYLIALKFGTQNGSVRAHLGTKFG